MKIAAAPTFTRNVTVLTPIDGGFRKESLKAVYNWLDTEAVDQFDLKTTDGTTAFLLAAVREIGDLTDDSDQPVAYTDAVRDALFKRQSVRQALCTDYFAAISKVATGN